MPVRPVSPFRPSLRRLSLDSSDFAHCPTSDPETTNTSADTKGTAMFDEQSLFALQGLFALLALLGLDSSDIAHCPTSDPVTTNTSADTKGTAMFDEQCHFGLDSPIGP